MKAILTKTTFIALFTSAALFAGNANAKIGNSAEQQKLETKFGFDVVSEIGGFIKSAVGESNKPAVQARVKRQLASDSIKLRTSQMVNSFNKEMPKVEVSIQD